MRRLRIDEQFIDRQAFIFRKRAEIDSKFDDRQQIERFFRAHGMRKCKHAVCATDLVPQSIRFFLDQNLARVVFLLDDGLDDFGQPGDNLLFFFAKRRLIGDLEEVAHRLGAFAIKTAHRQTDFADGLHDLIDQFAQDQTGQMQHGGRAHAGADVRRARGQITEPLIVSEFEFALQRGVDLVEKLERLFQLQTRAHRLHSQMIFFVDHDAERLAAIHDHRAARALCRMLATNEMSLDQNLFFQRGQVLQKFRKRILHLGKFFHARLDQFENRSALGLFRPAWKRAVAQIASQPHPAADDDLMMRSFTAEPFPRVGHDIRKFHSPTSSNRFRAA